VLCVLRCGDSEETEPLAAEEPIDGGFGDAPLAADALSLEVAGLQARDDIGFRDAEQTGDLGRTQHLERGSGVGRSAGRA